MSLFRLPAEFEKQEAVLLSFPFLGNDWPGKFGAIQWEFTEFIRKVSYYEKILLIVKSEEHGKKVKAMLNLAHADLENIEFIPLKTNRSWMRDSGPVTVKTIDGKRIALQFSFTGWAKYPNHRLDQKIPQKVAETLKIPVQKATYKEKHVVLEGGAIDVNGKGTMLTTKECLLHPTIQIRNQGFEQKDYEAVFQEYFGITNTIWLNEGIVGDDTHGHVDDICRFVNPTTVIACEEKNTKDKNHKKLAENLEILAGSTLENGKNIEVVKMPMPSPIYFDQMRLPASYVNFLIGNGFVLAPTFNDKNDYQALGILNELFPKREVIGINAIHLVWGLGTLHCLSHEIPA
ncbi:agmatine deiminase family protein [Namhaeicola litoreus]|uniref:Agmatine/peptidylarginine deiminase n=1 Tax=Namhaeicola litoreus TaxID=1052145 RepID=A0ABW3Y0P8_9FLAO